MVIGRVFGAPIIVKPSSLLMLALLAYVFASGDGVPTARDLVIGAALALALVTSVLLHELAHAAAARAYGLAVSEVVLTLWGGHTSFEARDVRPGQHAVTAAAGPAANVVIAGLSQAVLWLVPLGELGQAMLSYAVFANLALALFNLLPGIPMDGGRIFEAIVWGATGSRHRGTLAAAWAGRVVAIAVVAVMLGGPFLWGSQPSIFTMVLAGVVFSILWPAASATLAFARAMMKRERLSVGSLMAPAVPVHYGLSVGQALDAAESAGATHVIVMGADDTPAGYFTTAAALQVPDSARATTSLQSVTMPVPRGAAISLELTGDELTHDLRQWWGKTTVWVVTDGSQPVGIVVLADVLAALK